MNTRPEFRTSLNMISIIHWKEEGELHNPKNMTMGSYNLCYGVLSILVLSATIILFSYNLILSFLYLHIYVLLIHLTSYVVLLLIHASPSFHVVLRHSMSSH